MLYNLHFFSSKYRLFHNATLFGSCITHILKFEKKKSVAKRLNRDTSTLSIEQLLLPEVSELESSLNKQFVSASDSPVSDAFLVEDIPLCLYNWKLKIYHCSVRTQLVVIYLSERATSFDILYHHQAIFLTKTCSYCYKLKCWNARCYNYCAISYCFTMGSHLQ